MRDLTADWCIAILVLLSIAGCHGRNTNVAHGLLGNRALKQSENPPVDPQPYIAGGEDAAERVQYMASLRSIAGVHFCGGTLIHPLVVLTAAHCVEHGNKPTVHIGRYAKSGRDDDGFQEIETESVIIHEDYKANARFDNDVALLILKSKSDHEMIPLASSDYCFGEDGGCQVQILGWGDLSFRGSKAINIQQAFPTSLTHKECVDAYGPARVTDTMICAGDLEHGGVDSCTHDSGGPMILAGQQIGIISWGVGCGDVGNPGVYASIPKLLPWIESILAHINSLLPPAPPPLPLLPTPPPSPQVAKLCDCAEDGISGGVDTMRKGCKQHLIHSDDNGFFCMVIGGGECTSATLSKQFPGAAWKDCSPP